MPNQKGQVGFIGRIPSFSFSHTVIFDPHTVKDTVRENTMPLTDKAIRNAKPKDGPYKLHDERGLYLLINPSGKYFRMDYRYGGKRKTMAMGVYPEVPLKEARERRDAARKMLRDGVDPMQDKAEKKLSQIRDKTSDFEYVAREWIEKVKHLLTEGHASTVIRRLERHVFPWLGKLSVSEITPNELLLVLRRIEDQGAIETAHRVNQVCGQVFRYAIVTGRCDRNPAADLRGALIPATHKNMAAITDQKEIGALLRAIDGYEGHFVTKCALRLAPLVFVRPGELRQAEWKEIDFETATWKIPAEKMKMRRDHIVLLSRQAVAILQELHPLTGRGRYIFPSIRTSERPMSENTVLAALRRMGYSKDEMTGHGFRGLASTALHELGWQSDVIELQLAHAERNKVKAAYNHAEHLEERRKMMQAWADYLDGLRDGAKVVPFRGIEKKAS